MPGLLILIVVLLLPLADCLINEPDIGNRKLVWTLAILFLGPIGGLLYLLLRRPERIAEFGK